jgi:LPS-assembly lipoprotein
MDPYKAGWPWLEQWWNVGQTLTRRGHGKRAIAWSSLRALTLSSVLACGLTGCGSGGFQPLYATGSSGPAAARLAEVDIAPIPGRVGQRVRNDLVFDRSAAGDARAPSKRLEVKLTESLLTTLVQADGNSTGQTYQVEAVYRIVNTATNQPEYEGRSIARANFERFESVYANVRGREDAENRAAQTIANDIKTRLAVHLSR